MKLILIEKRFKNLINIFIIIPIYLNLNRKHNIFVKLNQIKIICKNSIKNFLTVNAIFIILIIITLYITVFWGPRGCNIF